MSIVEQGGRGEVGRDWVDSDTSTGLGVPRGGLAMRGRGGVPCTASLVGVDFGFLHERAMWPNSPQLKHRADSVDRNTL